MPDITSEQLRASDSFKRLGSIQDQQRVEQHITNKAWENTKYDSDYSLRSPEEQNAIKSSFDALYPMGKNSRVEEEGADNSFLENIGGMVKQGIGHTFDALRLADDVNTGNIDSDSARQIAKSSQGVNYTPEALKKTQAMLSKLTKAGEQADTWWDKAVVAGKAAYATVKEVATNPEGVAYLAAQSLPNMLPGLVTGAVGSLAGPAGAVAGQLSGQYATESGAYFLQKVSEEVYKRGLPMDEESVKEVMTDDEVMDEIITKSRLKGAGTALVDTLMSAGIGKMGSTGLKGAQKAKLAAKRYAAEVASEPISEGAGQLAAEGTVDAGELVGEALGGIGMGGITSAADVAIHGPKKTTEAIKETATKAKKVVSEIKREKPAEEVKLKEQAKATTKAKYKEAVKEAVKETVKEATETGDVKEFVKKEAKENPVKTVEVLQKVHSTPNIDPITKIKTQDEAQKVYQNLEKQGKAIIKEAGLLNSKEELTDEENIKLKSLVNQVRSIKTLRKNLDPIIKSMSASSTDQKVSIEQIQSVMKGSDSALVSGTILSVLGSKQNSILSDSTAIDTAINNPNVDATTIDVLQKTKMYQEAEAALSDHLTNSTAKVTDKVHMDVLEGSAGFNGIKTYLQAVAQGVERDDVDFAQAQIKDLTSFAKRHAIKAGVFQRVLDANLAGKTPTKADQKKMLEYNIERKINGSGPYSLGVKAKGFIQSIKLESEALNAAVGVANSLLPVQGKSNETVKTTEESANESSNTGTKDSIEKESTNQKSEDSLDTQTKTDEKETKPKTEKISKVERSSTEKGDIKVVQSSLKVGDKVSWDQAGKIATGTLKKADRGDWLVESKGKIYQIPSLALNISTKRKTSISEDSTTKLLHSRLTEFKEGTTTKVIKPVSEEHKKLVALGKHFGVEVVLFQGTDRNRNLPNGFTWLKDGRYVFINVASKSPLNIILGHEILHQLKGRYPKLYDQFRDQIAFKKDAVSQYSKQMLQQREGTPMLKGAKEQAEEELLADFMGDQFNREEFWQDLKQTNEPLFSKIILIAQAILNKISNYRYYSETYMVDVDSARKALIEMSKDVIKRDDSTVSKNTIKVVPGSLISPSEADPSNKLKSTFKVATRKVDSLFNKVKSISEDVSTALLKDSNLYTEEHPLGADDEAVVNSLGSYNREFHSAFQKSFEASKYLDYRTKDPIQFLLTDDKEMPTKVVDALSAVTFKWLSTEGQSTLANYDDDMRKILKLKDYDSVTSMGQQLLSDIGTPATLLQESIGREVLNLLGIEEDVTADHDMSNKLELSLGLQAIAALQTMGYLEQTDIRNGKKTIDGTVVEGFRGLVNYHKAEDVSIFDGLYDSFKPLTGKENLADQGKITFYKLANEEKAIESVIDPYRDSPDTWNKLFMGENTRNGVVWSRTDAKRRKEEMKLKKTDFFAPEEPSKNLQDSINKPYQVSKRTMGAYLLLNDEQRDKLLGAVDPETVHEVNLKGALGTNRAIDLSNQYIAEWLKAAGKRKDGYDSKFYVPAEFWRQGRMGQVGDINPQGDKAHRFLFDMSAWEKSIDLGDQQIVDEFMEAIALGLDKETTKEGGMQGAIAAGAEVLEKPVVKKAISAAIVLTKAQGDFNKLEPEKLIKLQDKYKSLMDTITDGAIEIANGVHGMKTIIEYARFKVAMATYSEDSSKNEFKTDMATEIDGVSNGMTLGRMQLMGDTASLGEQLTALQNAGVSFNLEDPGLAEHLAHDLSHDAYQTVGFHWGNALVTQERSLIDSNNQTGLDKFHALKSLFGNFRDDSGNVNSVVRKMSKDPTMKTVYGMGDKALIKELGDKVVADVYSQIEKCVADNDVDALSKLNILLKTLTGAYLYDASVIGEVDGVKKIKPEVALFTKLSGKAEQRLRQVTGEYHGEALKEAIKNVYGPMQETFKPLNNGIGATAVMYNVARKLLIAKAQKKADATREPNKGESFVKLTVQEYKDIDAKIEAMFPHVVNMFGGKIPLAKKSREKVYNFRDRTKGKKKTIKGHNVQQKYKNLPGKKAAPFKKEGVSSPGVGGTILTVHNMDSVIANINMGKYQILNNHDGFTTGVGTAVELAKSLNESFYKVMTDFNMGEALSDSAQGIKEEFDAVTKEFDSKEVSKLLAEEFKTMGTKWYTLPGAKKAVPVSGDNVFTIVDNILQTMHEVGQETKANKKMLTDAIVSVEQYSYPGGEYYTGNKGGSITYKGKTYPTGNITKLSQEKLIEKREEVNALLDPTEVIKEDDSWIPDPTDDTSIMYSSKSNASKLSVDPADYDTQLKVNAMNASEVYDQIKHDSTVHDSPAHDAHLKKLLNGMVRNVMDPIDLMLKSNPNIEPEGVYIHSTEGKGRVFISSQNQIIGPLPGALYQGIRMSTGEVYTHELLHTILRAGLEKNTRETNRVRRLFNIAKERLDANGEGYRAFLNDPDMDVNDPANQYEVAAAKERFDYIFVNTAATKSSKFEGGIDTATGIKRIEERSNYLDEFITLGLTNENFMRALSNITLTSTEYTSSTWKGVRGRNIQEILMNVGQMIMDFLFKKFSTQHSNGTISSELENLAVLLSRKDSEKKSMIFNALTQAGSFSGKVGTYGNNFIKNALKSWPVLKVGHELKQLSTIAKESNTLIGQRMREAEDAYRRQDQGIIKSTIDEMKGNTERLSWLYKLLDRRKLYLDAAKENVTDDHITMVNSLFKTPLEKAQKDALTRIGLKTDLSVLLNSLGSMNELLKVLKDDKLLEQKISDIQTTLMEDSELKEYATYYNRAADALGHFMITSRKRKDEEVFQNAHVIANMTNTTGEIEISNTAANRAEPLVDQLASLYALRYTAKQDRTIFYEVASAEPGAVNGVLRLHEVLKDKALKETFKGNKNKFIKGYTKQILNPRIGFKYGTADEAKEFAKKGYVRAEQPIPRDPADPTKNIAMYIYTSKTGRVNDLLSTIASFSSNKAKGTNSERIAQELNITSKEGRINNGKRIAAGNQTIKNMMDPKFKPSLDPGNFMVPAVDDLGHITQYRYMMAESTKDDYLEQVAEVDTILGSMAGQLVDKVRSPEINAELIDGLYGMYQADYNNNPSSFVEISPTSNDPRLKEIYYMLPAPAKKEIKTRWGKDSMMVSKDVVDLAFGYHQYSIVDAFAKDPADRAKLEKVIVAVSTKLFGDRAPDRMHTMEDIATEMTKIAKSNIIVKSLHVTLGNLGSNLVYLKSRGIPVSKILKLSWEAITMGNKYQVDIKALNQAKLQLKMMEKGKYTKRQKQEVKANILRLKDVIARNPTTTTIQAGLMPTLVDDVETVTGGQKFPNDYQKKIAEYTDKLNPTVRNVGKVMLLTEDTKAYKLLNNSVKMTDFIGRHVLYTHYMQEGMSHEKAVSSATEEFINFNVPTHKITEYLNTVGLLWFTKYGTRVLKVIKDSVVDKPFDVFMAFMMSTHIGLDNIANSIPGVTKDFFGNVGDPLSSFIESSDEPITINGLSTLVK